jgi:hypothetical protein
MFLYHFKSCLHHISNFIHFHVYTYNNKSFNVTNVSADPKIKQFYLRKWLKEPSLDCTDFRDLVDWQYYTERLSRSIQKIITIPAGEELKNKHCILVIMILELE